MYRSCVRQFAVYSFALTFCAVPVRAQDQAVEHPYLYAAAPRLELPALLSVGVVPEPEAPTASVAAAGRQRRPGALLPLYVAFASLQGLDAHSTRRALDRGAAEANPLMRGLAGNTAGMLAVKAAGTAGVIYAGEKIWKRNKAAAVLFMVAANSALAIVVQHNYRAVR